MGLISSIKSKVASVKSKVTGSSSKSSSSEWHAPMVYKAPTPKRSVSELTTPAKTVITRKVEAARGQSSVSSSSGVSSRSSSFSSGGVTTPTPSPSRSISELTKRIFLSIFEIQFLLLQ